MHGYFVPTTKTVVPKENSSKNIIKFTIKDSQESFLFLGKSYQEVEDHIQFLKEKKKNIQPFLYCVGSDFLHIEEIFIFFDNIRYQFFNFLRAVDICFKIFFVFNLDFPKESVMFYSFLETYFFKFKSAKNFPKVFMLASYLDSSN